MLCSLSYKLESYKATTVVSEPINSTLDPMLWYAVIQGTTKGIKIQFYDMVLCSIVAFIIYIESTFCTFQKFF